MPSMTAWSTFTDGAIVHQGALNNLSTNGDTLCQITTGKTSASGVSSPPAVLVTQTSAQSIPSGTSTLLSFNSATYNTDNMWTASQPTQLTIQTAGKYLLIAQVSWAAAFSGYRFVGILVNGTAIPTNYATSTDYYDTGVVTGAVQNCSQVMALAAGAVVYANTGQGSGAAQNTGTGATVNSSLSATWLTP